MPRTCTRSDRARRKPIIVRSEHLRELVRIESQVHYAVPPPDGMAPFVIVRRPSPILLSAPHGAITYRGNAREEWHQEDDYTGGMALLLAERCGTSAMATVWRTDDSDPNYHCEPRSPYKRALHTLVAEMGVRWVVDLHASADASLPARVLVDLGTRRELQSLPRAQLDRLRGLIEAALGPRTVSQDRFPARRAGRTITAFCHGALGLHAVQVEMKSAVRALVRRRDATAYAEWGPYRADPADVLGMMRALAEFVSGLGV
jgi:hypothetical protein